MLTAQPHAVRRSMPRNVIVASGVVHAKVSAGVRSTG
jgi:hypothetical protein